MFKSVSKWYDDCHLLSRSFSKCLQSTKDITECNKVPALLELTVLCENKAIKIFPVLERKFLHFYYNSWLSYKISVLGNQSNPLPHRLLHLGSRNNTWAS